MTKSARYMVVVAVIGVALLASSGPASAREHEDHQNEFDARGVYVGLGGMGNFVVNQANAPVDGFINHGGGFDVFVGVRLAHMLALEAGYTLNIHNPVQDSYGATVNALLLHEWSLDMKILFPNRSRVRPFLQAGLGLYELGSYPGNGDYHNGLGFQLGGGLDIFLNHFVSIGGRALYHGIYFTQQIGGDNPFLSTVSVEGNLQLHF